MNAIPLEQEIEYPTSDGQPMAETTIHRMVMFDLIAGLENRYAADPDVWAGGNLFLCYERGGLTFRPEGQRLRMVDLATGQPLLWPDEQAAALQTAQAQVRALQEELERLRGPSR